MKNNKGFTLVGLLVIIAIISIISVIAASLLIKSIVKTEVRAIKEAVLIKYTKNTMLGKHSIKY
ncbi:MAG: prepilin-type N-terminal cleavage/methylation domain-containing protein [Peptostreptococcaceae bacterium]